MLKRFEPRYLITARFAWEALTPQSESLTTVYPAVECPGNAAVVAFKGNPDGAEGLNFDWLLTATKVNGPELIIATGTGILGLVDDYVDAPKPFKYAKSLTISASDWFSPVIQAKSVYGGADDVISMLTFDMYGFYKLRCVCGPSTSNGVTSVSADVTWL